MALIIIFIVLLTNLNYKKRTAVLCNIKEFFIIDHQTGKLAAWVAIIAALAFSAFTWKTKTVFRNMKDNRYLKTLVAKLMIYP